MRTACLNNKLKLIRLNCAFALGPPLYKLDCTSVDVFTKILLGRYPGLPDIYMPIVDVRDIAEGHFKAIDCDLKESRYVLVENTYPYYEVGQVIYDEFEGRLKDEVDPTRTKLMYCTAKLAAWMIPEARPFLKAWGKNYKIESKYKSEMDIDYKELQQIVRNMTEALIEMGIVPLEK